MGSPQTQCIGQQEHNQLGRRKRPQLPPRACLAYKSCRVLRAWASEALLCVLLVGLVLLCSSLIHAVRLGGLGHGGPMRPAWQLAAAVGSSSFGAGGNGVLDAGTDAHTKMGGNSVGLETLTSRLGMAMLVGGGRREDDDGMPLPPGWDEQESDAGLELGVPGPAAMPATFELAMRHGAVDDSVAWHRLHPRLRRKHGLLPRSSNDTSQQQQHQQQPESTGVEKSGKEQASDTAEVMLRRKRQLVDKLLGGESPPEVWLGKPAWTAGEESEEARQARAEAYARRRELADGDGGPTWSTGLVVPALDSGATPADVNVSAYRWSSVAPANWVDWRLTRYMTNVQSQLRCESCWALVATDVIAVMWAIATRQAPQQLSAQQSCDCALKQCCQGGWPEWVLGYAIFNQGLYSADTYPYRATNINTCSSDATGPTVANITGWEKVPARNTLAMRQAVSMQPIIAFIDASTPDFATYRGGIYNGNCSNDVNHAVLIVGYVLSNLPGGSYWVIKNTWGSVWGESGYMKLAMMEGSGRCGINLIPPIYPVYYPNVPSAPVFSFGPLRRLFGVLSGEPWWWTWTANSQGQPCGGSFINPCGAGICLNVKGMARCFCPSGFVERTGVPTSKCVPANPCSGVLNPCGMGTCNPLPSGYYACICLKGAVMGSSSNGEPTCIPSGRAGGVVTYTTKYLDTCEAVKSTFRVADDIFQAINPAINCNTIIPPGLVILLTAPNQPIPANMSCTGLYVVTGPDTCASIARAFFKGDLAALQQANPTVDCDNLLRFQQICINGTFLGTAANVSATFSGVTAFLGGAGNSASGNGIVPNDGGSSGSTSTVPSVALSPLVCGWTYEVVVGDTCDSIMRLYNLTAATFYSLNLGLNCIDSNGAAQLLPPGLLVCVGQQTSTVAVACTDWHIVQQGDRCPLIWNAANLTETSFLAINPGIRCQPPFLQIGQLVCIASPLVATLDKVAANQTLIPYIVEDGDTLSTISLDFFSRCGTWAAETNICAANNLLPCNDSSIRPGMTVLVPCSNRVGATCGCTNSLPVCGSDNYPYPSYCHAVCNFASPVTNFSLTQPCDCAKQACQKRVGLAPQPIEGSSCILPSPCPYPTWPPSDWSWLANSNCSYYRTTCDQVATDSANTLGGTSATWLANKQNIFNNCFCCFRIPKYCQPVWCPRRRGANSTNDPCP